MSNKAKKDKGSILIDVEDLLDVYEEAFMNMPKIRRLHGAAVRMEDAAYDLIQYFSIAYNLKDNREKIYYVNQMVGAYGRMQSAFKRLMSVKMDCQVVGNKGAVRKMNLLSDSVKLSISEKMERIEEGIKKWNSYIRDAAS